MKMFFWNSEQKTDVLLAACVEEVFFARPTLGSRGDSDSEGLQARGMVDFCLCKGFPGYAAEVSAK
jgi:hypothetical protein